MLTSAPPMSCDLSALPDDICQAATLSRFLRRMLDSRPWLGERLAAHFDHPVDAEAMQAFLAERIDGTETLKPALRDLRTWVVCHVLVPDLAGRAGLDEVTEAMTVLAETAIRTAHDLLRATLVERYGLPLLPTGWEQELLVIGMGKLGGRELNVSSDNDLIFIYPEDGDTG